MLNLGMNLRLGLAFVGMILSFWYVFLVSAGFTLDALWMECIALIVSFSSVVYVMWCDVMWCEQFEIIQSMGEPQSIL